MLIEVVVVVVVAVDDIVGFAITEDGIAVFVVDSAMTTLNYSINYSHKHLKHTYPVSGSSFFSSLIHVDLCTSKLTIMIKRILNTTHITE